MLNSVEALGLFQGHALIWNLRDAERGCDAESDSSRASAARLRASAVLRSHTWSQARPADASASRDGREGAARKGFPASAFGGWPAKAPLSPTWFLIVLVPLRVRVPSGAEKTTGALQTDKWTHSLTTLPSLCRPPSPPLLPGRRAFSRLETEAASRCELSFHSFATREGSPQRSRQAGHRAPGAGRWVLDGPERTIFRGRAERGSLLLSVLKVSTSRGCEGTSGLWAFTASSQASPTRPPYACLPLVGVGEGENRKTFPLFYFILLFLQFVKSRPLRAQCLRARVQNLKTFN